MNSHFSDGPGGSLFFARQTPDGPLLLRVFTDKCERVLAGGYPWRFWAVTRINDPDEEGLPSDDEAAMLAQEEEELLTRLPGDRKAVYCGNLQHRGEFVTLIHSSSPDVFSPGETGDRQLFTSVYVWNIYCREDRAGDFLANKFMPTPKERRRIGDLQVLEALATAGDQAAKPRPIRFFGLFVHREGAAQAASLLAGGGFTVSDTTEIPSRSGPRWSVMFEVESPADPASIEQLSSHAQRLCESAGGEYDGWECAPVEA